MNNAQPRDDIFPVLLDRSRLYLKLDLAYLAAAGAIVTALNIGRGELFDIGASLWPLAISFAVVALIDVLIEETLFGLWLRDRNESQPKQIPKALVFFMKSQSSLHWLFIAGMLFFFLGMARGRHYAKESFEGQVEIQEEVDAYIREYGVVPESISKLNLQSKRYISGIRKLHGEKFSLSRVGEKEYSLRFAGKDNVLNTGDDRIATEELSLRLVMDAVEKDDNLGR